MVVYSGTLLSWPDTQKVLNLICERGIEQFLNVHRRWKDRNGDPFKWGEEMEYMLVKHDNGNKEARLSLKAESLLTILNNNADQNQSRVETLWSAEVTTYMLEACPVQPYEGFSSCFAQVETKMRDHRMEVTELLDGNEVLMTLAGFLRVEVPNFTSPIYEPQPEKENGIERSKYFPDEAIISLALLVGTVKNIRERRGKNVDCRSTIFKDQNTKIPVDGAPDDKPDAVHLNAVGFGFGCCALQTTFQASNLSEALNLYDQMAVLCPVMIALTAATPATRGYLIDTDSRWTLIKETTDDRTDEERGVAPLKENQKRIPKCRFDSIDCYASPAGDKYNDMPLGYNQEYYQKLRDGGVDHSLAQQFSQLLSRDVYATTSETIQKFNENDTDYIDLALKMSWPSIKLKCPTSSNVGWRIEFRPCDIQLTDFDNAAIACFSVLLTRIILANNLNLLIPISKLDKNMHTAQKQNACRTRRFWFRKNIFGNKTGDTELELMTIDEIINGNESSFPGLFPLMTRYMSTLNIDPKTRSIHRYLKLVQQRASGKLMTPASWIRREITQHKEYKRDSVVSERVTFDLMKKIQEIQEGKRHCDDLHGSSKLRQVESQGHVTGSCPSNTLLITNSHHKVKHHMKQLLQDKGLECFEEVHAIDSDGQSRFSDIIAFDTKKKTAYIVDPMFNKFSSFQFRIEIDCLKAY